VFFFFEESCDFICFIINSYDTFLYQKQDDTLGRT